MTIPAPVRIGLTFIGIIVTGMGAVMVTLAGAKKFAKNFEPKGDREI